MDLEYLKGFREIKDIADIIDDIEKLDSLVSKNAWNEVEHHLWDVSQKHPAEKVIYNSINNNPPCTIQESAIGCRQFLVMLGSEKITEELSKRLGRA